MKRYRIFKQACSYALAVVFIFLSVVSVHAMGNYESETVEYTIDVPYEFPIKSGSKVCF